MTELSELPVRDGGAVYFVSGADLVKIGYTRQEVASYIQSTLVNRSPIPLTIERVLAYREPLVEIPNIEAYLHRRFEVYRAHGEWFRREPIMLSISGISDEQIHDWAVRVNYPETWYDGPESDHDWLYTETLMEPWSSQLSLLDKLMAA